MAVVNTGMAKGEMEKLLNLSKDEPVGCAIGTGPDAAYGLLILNKMRSGAALEKQMKTEFPDAKNTRFGKAFVDVDDNAKQVKLTLNRSVSGIAKRLIKTLKGTGFNKVILVTEDGAVCESHEEADEEAVAEADAAVAGAAAPEVTATPEVATAPPPPPPPAPPAPAAGQTPEEKAALTSALAKQLAALIPAIPKAAGTDDARKAAMMKFATDANVNIKTGNLTYAANFIEQLKAAMAGSGEGATPQAVATSRLAWVDTKKRVEADVEKLRTALETTYADAPYGKEIDTKFRTVVAPVLAAFDDRLTDALDDLMNETDETKRTQAIAGARAVMKDYLSFAMSDKLIGDLDANPFVPLTIRSTVTTTLAALAKTMH